MSLAYVVIPGNKPGERIGIVKQGESGYFPAKGYDYAPHTEEQVKEFVNTLNSRMGIPEEVAQSALCGSMFGWHCPAAEKANEFFSAKAGRA